MVFGLYNVAMRLGTPALKGYLELRRKNGKEDIKRMPERQGVPSLERPAGFMVWAHAASNGEALSLLPVVTALIDAYPKLEVLVTTGTVTSARLMAQRLPPRAFHQYVPVDHPDWVGRFLDHWHPDLVLWAESDLWPNMLAGIRQRKIPAFLLNARMSERSFRRWSRMKGVARRLFSSFTTCFAQNDAERTRLEKLGAPDVRMAGNLKYASHILPAPQAERDALRAMLGDRPAVLWASTHEGEEEVAVRIHHILREKLDKRFVTVIAPRHPRRGDEIAAALAAQNLVCKRRSLHENIDEQTNIYLADTIGELGVFFAEIPHVVMGGTFGDTGGHNPIEPAQFGNAIFFGPSRHNFLTMVDEFTAAHAMILAGSEEELAEKLISAYHHPDTVRAIGDAAKALVVTHARVLDDVLGAIRIFIKDNAS